MQIRPLEKNNQTEITRLHQVRPAAYRIEADLLGIQPDLFFPLKYTLSDLQNSKAEIFVFLIEETMAGAIFLEKNDTSIVISNLVVDPQFFRRGVAKSLVTYCLNLYPKQEFQVATGKLNSPAIRLYEDFRFETIKEEIVGPDLKIVKLRRLPFE